MIKNHCFSEEWINKFKALDEHKNINEIILEKMIYALHLLEQLKTHKLEFIFKGGTSLVLLLHEDNRFSIDIDIICKENRYKLESVLDRIVENSQFNGWKLQNNRSYKPGVPKAHYEFSFHSKRSGSGTILLDVLMEETLYPEIIKLPIKTKWIDIENEIIVKLPSIDAITGDKLTAFAPNTIGIPYFKGQDNESRTMEICKQLFDLSKLFERIQNMGTVIKSYKAFAEKEISYRKKGSINFNLLYEDALRDTIEVCFIISTRGKANGMARVNFTELQNGIRAFGSNYLMKGKFRIDEAIPASARVSYLAAKILADDSSPIEYYREGNEITEVLKGEKWTSLNKLKRQPDKSSFYYWSRAVELLESMNDSK